MSASKRPPDRSGDIPKENDGSPLAPLDDSSLSFYTIGQVAELLDVAQPALRRLDGLDIVRPDRSEGGQRRYSKEEVQLLKEVLDLTDNGVTLAGVRIVLELRQRVSELEEEIAQLHRRLAIHPESSQQSAQSADD